MRLQETNPDQFNTYVQMAADAAQLAKEQPEVFQALMQETAAGTANVAVQYSKSTAVRQGYCCVRSLLLCWLETHSTVAVSSDPSSLTVYICGDRTGASMVR